MWRGANSGFAFLRFLLGLVVIASGFVADSPVIMGFGGFLMFAASMSTGDPQDARG